MIVANGTHLWHTVILTLRETGFEISIRPLPFPMGLTLINKISVIIIMFNKKITYNKPYPFQKNIPLTKFRTSYDKLEKEMTKPPSDYDSIKTLIGEKTNHITNVQNNINKKSKNNLSIQSHSKNNNKIKYIYIVIYKYGQYSGRVARYNDK